jgi:hypothetical protein
VTEEKVQNLLQILYLEPFVVGLILLGISVLYFLEGRHMAFFERILKSSHGIFFLCLMYPLVLRNSTAYTDAGWFGYPYWAFFLLGLATMVYSLAGRYVKHWILHFLHVFTILYGSLAALYGMNTLPPDYFNRAAVSIIYSVGDIIFGQSFLG